MTTEVLIVILAIGGAGGWYLGRMWSEDTRARKAMEKTWAERQDYRKKPEKK